MESTASTPARAERALVPLLTAITVLLAILVVGLGTGAVLALRAVHAAREQVARLTGDSGDAKQQARGLGSDLVERQQRVASQLTAEATATEEKLQTFQARLKQLYPIAQGLTRKLDQTIALTLLMNDQMILMNHQLAALQKVAARGIRPMASERALTAPDPGTGGSGQSGEAAQTPRPRQR